MKTDRITISDITITIDDGENIKLSADIPLVAKVIASGTQAEPITFDSIRFSCECGECNITLLVHDSGTIELSDDDDNISVYGWLSPSQATAIREAWLYEKTTL